MIFLIFFAIRFCIDCWYVLSLLLFGVLLVSFWFWLCCCLECLSVCLVYLFGSFVSLVCFRCFVLVGIFLVLGASFSSRVASRFASLLAHPCVFLKTSLGVHWPHLLPVCFLLKTNLCVHGQLFPALFYLLANVKYN